MGIIAYAFSRQWEVEQGLEGCYSVQPYAFMPIVSILTGAALTPDHDATLVRLTGLPGAWVYYIGVFLFLASGFWFGQFTRRLP